MWGVLQRIERVKELIKYPPQFKIGFLSNNPPVYDLLPKAREARATAVKPGLARMERRAYRRSPRVDI